VEERLVAVEARLPGSDRTSAYPLRTKTIGLSSALPERFTLAGARLCKPDANPAYGGVVHSSVKRSSSEVLFAFNLLNRKSSGVLNGGPAFGTAWKGEKVGCCRLE